MPEGRVKPRSLISKVRLAIALVLYICGFIFEVLAAIVEGDS